MNKNNVLVVRLCLGLIFTVFGLNGFLHFIPMPQPAPAAGAFFMALTKTGYMIPLIFGTQFICGLLLLGNIFVPFAIVALAPVVLNIALFHLFLDINGILMAIIVLTLELYLIFAYKDYFAGVFTKETKIK